MTSGVLSLKIHLKIFHRDVQKTKTFTVFLDQMLVVLLMTASDGLEIGVVGAGKQFNTLVNEDIVHQKIGNAVEGNAEADVKQIIEFPNRTKVHQRDRRQGEDDKKVIVFFHGTFVAVVVVIPVQYPEKSMHHVFVDEPGSSFHGDKYGKYYQYIHHLSIFCSL